MPDPTPAAGPGTDLADLRTEELRHRAFSRAERHLDIGFFWDLARHLQPAHDAASEDGSSGGIGGTLTDAVALVRQLSGRGFGEAEPMIRARLIDYLREHGG